MDEKIDKLIKWEAIDALTVKGTLETNGCKVSAKLYFNDKGEYCYAKFTDVKEVKFNCDSF